MENDLCSYNYYVTWAVEHERAENERNFIILNGRWKMIFAVILCFLSSRAWKGWKNWIWMGLEPNKIIIIDYLFDGVDPLSTRLS